MNPATTKYRKVVTAAGNTFDVPVNVSRVDTDRWHGWQVRIKRSVPEPSELRKWFGDTEEGYIGEASGLLKAKLWANKNRTPKMELINPDAGINLVIRPGNSNLYIYLDARSPDPKVPRKSFYVGSFDSATEASYQAALLKARAYRAVMIYQHQRKAKKP